MASVTSGGAIVTRKLSVSIQGQCQPKTGNMSCLKTATTPTKSSQSGRKQAVTSLLNLICQGPFTALRDLVSSYQKVQCLLPQVLLGEKSDTAMGERELAPSSLLIILSKLPATMLEAILRHSSKRDSVKASILPARCQDILIRDYSWRREEQWGPMETIRLRGEGSPCSLFTPYPLSPPSLPLLPPLP